MMTKLLTRLLSCLAALLPLSLDAAFLVVNNGSPDASDDNPGTEERPFKTINAAAQAALPGDTVWVAGGVYRERVAPARGGTDEAPIVYHATPGEHVEVKGSDLWSAPWAEVAGRPRVYTSRIAAERFADGPNPYRTRLAVSASTLDAKPARPVAAEEQDRPWPRTLGQVFMQGELLAEVQTLAQLYQIEGAWIVSADGDSLLVHLPGTLEAEALFPTLEWSVRNRIFAPAARGLANIHVKGFTFLHCANQGPFPQGGAVSPRTGRDWLIEGNTIRYAKTIGLDIGAETWDGANLPETRPQDRRFFAQAGHTVRSNVISDNGLCGIAGWTATNCRIYNNLLERNNRQGFPITETDWEEWAAIKLHGSNAIIAGNIIRSNEAHGIWMDNGYDLSRITGNVLIDNRLSGIMLELGAGSALVDNNVVAFTRSDGRFYDGNGIYTHDASGVTVAHNLLYGNAGAGVLMRTITARKFGEKLVETTGQRVVNNLFANNAKGALSLPFENTRATNNVSDYNVFLSDASFRLNRYQEEFAWDDVRRKLQRSAPPAKKEGQAVLQNEGAFLRLDLAQWQAAGGWDTNSVAEDATDWSLLPNRMLLRYQLPASVLAMRCPPVDEMDWDFAGEAYATNAVVPGPFQMPDLGKRETTVNPFLYSSRAPELRTRGKRHTREAWELAFEELLKNLPATAGLTLKSFSLGAAQSFARTGADRWFYGVQECLDPAVTAPFDDSLKPGPVSDLYRQSPAGVCASSAASLLLKLPDPASYALRVAGRIRSRKGASAGFVRVTLFQLDGTLQNGREIKRIDLNTPDGYLGDTLPAEFEVHETVACPAESYVGVRLQVVAPGPAPAGSAHLEVTAFEVAQLRPEAP